MDLLRTIVFGVLGLVLSFGFFIPPELSIFRLIAAFGVMVGYQLGQLVGKLVRQSPKRFLSLIVGAVLCLYFAFAYASVIQMGSQYIGYRELRCVTWLVFPLARIFITLHTRSC